MISASTNSRTKKPIKVDIKTKIERSLFIMIPIIPVTKEDIPAAAAKMPGIARKRLSKNFSPPLCPEATRIKNIPRIKKKEIINPTDHLERHDFGIKLIFIYLTPDNYYTPSNISEQLFSYAR